MIGIKKKIFKKKNAKRLSRRVLIRRRNFALAFLLIGFFLYIFGKTALEKSSFFHIKELKVSGSLEKIAEEDLKLLSGIKQGDNIFSVDIKDVKAKLKALKDLKEVSVRRSLPSTIILEVKEYKPSFVLNTGRFYYVDQEGDVYKDISNTKDSKDFPFLSGLDEKFFTEDREAALKVIQEALSLKKAYHKFSLHEQLAISELNYDRNNGFTLYPEKKKYSIKVGSDQFEEKFKNLLQALDQLNHSKSKISTIDLNYSGKILVKI